MQNCIMQKYIILFILQKKFFFYAMQCFCKKAGNLQFCIKSLYLLPQFLGFFCFPCEKPHT